MSEREASLRGRLSRYFTGRSVLPGGTTGCVRAAVLIPLYERGGTLYALLTRRSHRVPFYKGQYAFPGGRVRAGDTDLRQTALREAYEEVGIRPADVEVVGELDDIMTGEFCVRPVVGFIPFPYPIIPDQREVDEIFSVPLSDPSAPASFLGLTGQILTLLTDILSSL